MNIKTIILLTLLTAATNFAAIPQYDIIPLGKLTDETDEYSQVFSINDSGQIVGTAIFLDDWTGSPVLYQPGNYDTAINLMPNTVQRPMPVLNNNSGQIIGIDTSNNSVSITLFDQTGQGNNITTVAPDSFGVREVISINDLGQIPGNDSGAALLNTLQSDSISRFDTPSGYSGGTAHGVNNLGQAVGVAGYISNEQYYEHAMLFEEHRVTSLGTLGGDNSYAFAINNSGQVVGMADNEQGQPVATIFDTTGQGNNIPLGLLDSDSTLAIAINDDGQTIVWAREKTGPYYWDYMVTGIYLYDDQDIINFEDLLPEDAGWDVRSSWDINNHGQIIGWGYLDGEQRAFLMTPVPEPATLTILAIGALLIRRRKYIY